jgi:PhnB protein
MRRVSPQQLAQEVGTMAVKAIPDGYHSVTPYLVVPRVAQLLDFLKQAFAAQEIHRPMTRPEAGAGARAGR